MLPTNANSFSRSTYYSQSSPSSITAPRVSWGFSDINISFDMNTPRGAPDRGGARVRARSTGVGQGGALRWPLRAAQERLPLLHQCFPHPMLTLLKIWITGRRIFRGSGTDTADFFALHCGRVLIYEAPHADV